MLHEQVCVICDVAIPEARMLHVGFSLWEMLYPTGRKFRQLFETSQQLRSCKFDVLKSEDSSGKCFYRFTRCD